MVLGGRRQVMGLRRPPSVFVSTPTSASASGHQRRSATGSAENKFGDRVGDGTLERLCPDRRSSGPFSSGRRGPYRQPARRASGRFCAPGHAKWRDSRCRRRTSGHDYLGLPTLAMQIGRATMIPTCRRRQLPDDYGSMVRRITRDWDARLVFEPGRLIVGNAGVLLSRVIRIKPGATDPFVHTRCGHERPHSSTALYDAQHRIEAVRPSGNKAQCECGWASVRNRGHLRDR